MRFALRPNLTQPWADAQALARHADATGWDGVYIATQFSSAEQGAVHSVRGVGNHPHAQHRLRGRLKDHFRSSAGAKNGSVFSAKSAAPSLGERTRSRPASRRGVARVTGSARSSLPARNVVLSKLESPIC
jgi:hypothetical protein